MNESLLAVLLMGSPRRTKSTSQALGSYLMDKLRAKDIPDIPVVLLLISKYIDLVVQEEFDVMEHHRLYFQ